MAAKYKNPPIWANFGFQVDYDVANWYPSLVCYGSHFESKMATKIQKSSDLGEILFPIRLWCCELIFIVGLLWWLELDETFQKFCLTCVHIILRLRNFRMAVVATTNVNNLKCSEWDKFNRNVVWHVYKWFWGLEISKCLPLPWKPQKHSIQHKGE